MLDLVDTSRQTDPTPGVPGDEVAGRRLPTTIWYPVNADGPVPVVVFSHGLNSAPAEFDQLLPHWAASGMIVVAPTHPLTSKGSALVTDDITNQPADVSFVLTQVLALNGTQDDALAGRIDPTRIAMAGHSAGAMTTLGLLNACCHDERFTAAVVLAGRLTPFGSDFTKPGVPMLFEHGSADASIPLAEGQAAYAAAPGPKAAIELLGATHSTPYNEVSDPAFAVVRDTTTDFLRWALLGDDAALAQLRADADVPDVAALQGDDLDG